MTALTPAELADARRLLRSVEATNRAKKRSNAAIRVLWAAWDDVADAVMARQQRETDLILRAVGVAR